MNRIAIGLASLASLLLAGFANAAGIDWNSVDKALGAQGKEQPGGVYKYSLPRSDLKVTVDDVAIRPALALGGWVAFTDSSETMVMGDLVLTDREISPVMKHLLQDGVQVTAVHNHLLRTSVPIFYMHIEGHGNPVKLAESLHAALALSKTPLNQLPAAPASPPALDLGAIDQIMGRKGTANGGVYQFSFPRAESISVGNMSVPASMGTATGINFQPTTAVKAAVTGDFVLIGPEVNAVLKTLRADDIEVTALHSHMIDDSPRLYFMHFWANDDAQKLARGLRAALDQTNLMRP